MGNLNDHRAAYPDIDWPKHMKSLVEGFGLKYNEMTDQCPSFVEIQVVAGYLNQFCSTTEKFGDDLWIGIENFMFDKLAKPTDKGSSVMAQKKNPWLLEGGGKALKKGIHMLKFTTDELRQYRYEGDMGRSFLTRDIGADYSRIVLGISRIGREPQQYVPHVENINNFTESNPGLSTASIMGILKRAGVGGDAYRLMQSLSYDKETSRNKTREEYVAGLKGLIEEGTIPKALEPEIMDLLVPEKCLGYAPEFTINTKQRCIDTITEVKEVYGIGEYGKEMFKFKGG